MSRFPVRVAFAGLLLACGSSGHPIDGGTPDAGVADSEAAGCVDEDGDGAGVGADCASEDCDDTDPLTTRQCGTGCEDFPQRLGCPCSSDEPEVCFHGPQEASGLGTCKPGLQRCVAGTRGPCEGQVLPSAEQCDGLDEDCDGDVDDGVTNECGSCGDCREGACFGPGEGCIAWSAGRLDHALEAEDRGLTVSRMTDGERVVWTTHKGNCIAYEVDPATRAIIGAYLTSDQEVQIQATTVDREGNFVVPHHQGSWVTRIARDEATCPDRNQNGVIDTSHGADEILPWSSPDQWEDECILWHTQVTEGAATVALHESYGLDALVEHVWVGIDDDYGALETGFVELDLETGEATGRFVATPGFAPIGSAVDDQGRIWAVGNTTTLASFNPGDPEPSLDVHFADAALKTVTIDKEGDVWVRAEGLRRFDETTGVFEGVFDDWEPDQRPGGHVVADGGDGIWQVDELPIAYRVDAATLEWEAVDLGDPGDQLAPYGVANLGVDFLGQAWVLANWVPGALVYDLVTEEVALALDDCGGVVCDNAAAHGDFTGLPWAIVQPERGVWTDQLVACEESNEVVWNGLRATCVVPSGSRVNLMVRTGSDDSDLWLGEWLLAGPLANGENDLDLSPVLGELTHLDRFFALQVRLEADRGAESPAVSAIDVSWGCRSVQ